MNPTACSRRQRGFTLIEIMFVVLVVALFTGLAAFVVGRIKDRATRSLLNNNLRQLYQAKEFFFAESGQTDPVGIKVLVQEGYVTESLYGRLYLGNNMESKMGWHYGRRFVANEPTYAFQGDKQRGQAPTKEIVYYPGPPSSLAALFADPGPAQVTPAIPTPIVPNPVVTTVQPTIPPPTTQAPATSLTPGATVSGGSTQPPQPPAQTAATQGPAVVPPSQNQGNSNQGNGPGNSDFGHSHNQGHNQGHGQGHGKP